jgi:hypothetical protein
MVFASNPKDPRHASPFVPRQKPASRLYASNVFVGCIHMGNVGYSSPQHADPSTRKRGSVDLICIYMSAAPYDTDAGVVAIPVVQKKM